MYCSVLTDGMHAGRQAGVPQQIVVLINLIPEELSSMTTGDLREDHDVTIM